MMRALAFLLLLCFSAAAAAQLRTIPKEAVLGQMRHLEAIAIGTHIEATVQQNRQCHAEHKPNEGHGLTGGEGTGQS